MRKYDDFLNNATDENGDCPNQCYEAAASAPAGAEELFDVVNDDGLPTGITVPRSRAHAEGIPHRTAHVWIIRSRDGVTEVLLQKRSEEKDSYPGCYDISSAGHIPAGSDFAESALRELKEELGVVATPEELVFVKDMKASNDCEFRGRPFKDREYFRIFVLVKDVLPEALSLQPEEVSEVRWMALDEACEGAVKHGFPNCLRPAEIGAVAEYAERIFRSGAEK